MNTESGEATPLTGRPAKARLSMVQDKEPLSYLWGTDRGMPIHRHYLENFLTEFQADIRGDCMEFQNPQYTPRFGGDNVTNIDILHIDDTNELATLVADLTQENTLADDMFDCIVCTHVLHMVLDVPKFISEVHRILRPGGVLLIAVPHVSMCDPQYHELWRFTPEGLDLLLGRSFQADNVVVRAYGNSLTAAGEIRGMVIKEFTAEELNYHDPRFAVEVCARAVKAQSN